MDIFCNKGGGVAGGGMDKYDFANMTSHDFLSSYALVPNCRGV